MSEKNLTIEDVILPAENLNGELSWQELFGNENPVQVEIGSGKGTFLVNTARANPQTNYLGIEWANKYYKYAADRARRWGLDNVKMLRCDAKDFITHNSPADSIQALHIYFPDPWPKKRHHKRRLFDAKFITAAIRALIPNGQLHVATDHKEYFEIIEPLLAAAEQLELEDFAPRETAQLGEWVGTNFERKYLAEGRVIYSCSARKFTAPAH